MTSRNIDKLTLVVELIQYIKSQKNIIYNLYLETFKETQSLDDDKTKKINKVWETMSHFELTINEDSTISIVWFDGFNGDIFLNNVDIDSQIFCYTFMLFFNSLTYRIMAALQYYSPSGWCLNELWETRVELSTRINRLFTIT